jgi:methionyl-tRNA synthetase
MKEYRYKAIERGVVSFSNFHRGSQPKDMHEIFTMHIHRLNALLKEYLEFAKISGSYCIACRIFLMINK